MQPESSSITKPTPQSDSIHSPRLGGHLFSWPVLAVSVGVPFGFLVLIHLVRFRMVSGSVYPGVFRSDMFYYLANAREIFENGNGLFYGDPFSGSFDSPRVFSHLQLLMMGWVWRLTDLPLEVVWQLAQVVFGITMFWTLHRLLAEYFGGKRLVYAFVLISLAGGGATLQSWLGAIVSGSEAGYLDGFRALYGQATSGAAWLPNVFQNALFTTQSFYHTLAFGTFAAVLAGRTGWGTLGLFLVWWAHPFTGIEVGGIVGAFTVLEAALSRTSKNLRSVVAVLTTNLVFVLYYLVAIPVLSPEAADITSRWRDAPAFLAFGDVFAMWGIFLAAPFFFLVSSIRPLNPRGNRADRFLVVWLGVVAALLTHEKFLPSFIEPFQPLHFAHGYFFVPLVILLLRGLILATGNVSPKKVRIAAAALLAIACVDNAVYCYELANADPPVLTADVAKLAEFLEKYEPPSMVHVDFRTGPLIQYLMVGTPHKIYLYSEWQTPFYEEKLKRLGTCFKAENSAFACGELGIRLVVASNATEPAFLRDIAAGRAHVAFRVGRFQVIDLSGE